MPITANKFLVASKLSLEDAKETKNATFFVLYSAKRIYKKYKMAAE
jgi:hypothetical protein